MSILNAVDCGTLHIVDDNSGVNVYAADPLPASWQKISLEEYIPKGSKVVRFIIDATGQGTASKYIYSFTLDTSVAVTAMYNKRGRLIQVGSGTVRETYIMDVPVNSDREVWIAAYDTSAWKCKIQSTVLIGYWI